MTRVERDGEHHKHQLDNTASECKNNSNISLKYIQWGPNDLKLSSELMKRLIDTGSKQSTENVMYRGHCPTAPLYF